MLAVIEPFAAFEAFRPPRVSGHWAAPGWELFLVRKPGGVGWEPLMVRKADGTGWETFQVRKA